MKMKNVTRKPAAALTRFSVSLEQALLRQFDARIAREGCPTRSKAVADLVRASLVRDAWQAGRVVAAAIVLVYDHHRRGLAQRLTHVQHDYPRMIIASQHVHLDHDNCLEVIVARGRPDHIKQLADRLKGAKGVKYCALAAASTGQGL